MINYLKELFSRKENVEPPQIDDPLAQRISWGPLNSGGASFCTHCLKTIDHTQMEFRASWAFVLFICMFLIAGCLGVFFGSFEIYRQEGPTIATIAPLVIGLVFIIISFFFTSKIFKVFIFDKKIGFCWQEYRGFFKKILSQDKEQMTPLGNIHALQLVSEYCSGNKNSFYSYEINLVLKDGKRVNVVDHGNWQMIQQQVHELALFLGVPVWKYK